MFSRPRICGSAQLMLGEWGRGWASSMWRIESSARSGIEKRGVRQRCMRRGQRQQECAPQTNIPSIIRYTHMCTCIFVDMYVHVHARTRVHTRVHARTHKRTCTRAHTPGTVGGDIRTCAREPHTRNRDGRRGQLPRHLRMGGQGGGATDACACATHGAGVPPSVWL